MLVLLLMLEGKKERSMSMSKSMSTRKAI